uniref:Uncharacterized protein n=1 Tax=Anopheles stephensi TaxID=30069 RepID=A0A182XZY2_ANOST
MTREFDLELGTQRSLMDSLRVGSTPLPPLPPSEVESNPIPKHITTENPHYPYPPYPMHPVPPLLPQSHGPPPPYGTMPPAMPPQPPQTWQHYQHPNANKYYPPGPPPGRNSYYPPQ